LAGDEEEEEAAFEGVDWEEEGLFADGGGRRRAAQEVGGFLTGGGAGAGGGAGLLSDVAFDGSAGETEEGRLMDEEVGVVSSVLGVEIVGVDATEVTVVGGVEVVTEDEDEAVVDGTEEAGGCWIEGLEGAAEAWDWGFGGREADWGGFDREELLPEGAEEGVEEVEGAGWEEDGWSWVWGTTREEEGWTVENVEGDETDEVEGMLTAGADDGDGAEGVGADGAVCEGGGKEVGAETEAVEEAGAAAGEGAVDALGGGASFGRLLLLETDFDPSTGFSSFSFSLPPNARSLFLGVASLSVGRLDSSSSPSSHIPIPNLTGAGMLVILVEIVRAGARERLRGAWWE
jgi:hypothetical protein